MKHLLKRFMTHEAADRETCCSAGLSHYFLPSLSDLEIPPTHNSAVSKDTKENFWQ